MLRIVALLNRRARAMPRRSPRTSVTPALSIAKTTDSALTPAMSIKDAMRAFDDTESDTLIVVDSLDHRRLLGTLNEAYATRRYAEEMERNQSF